MFLKGLIFLSLLTSIVEAQKIAPTLFSEEFWFLEDAFVDPKQAYTYFESLAADIENIRKEKLLSELYTWVRIESDTVEVSFSIPMKNYDELGKIQLNWNEIKKKYPTIAPKSVDSYSQQLNWDLSYKGDPDELVEYDLTLEVNPENVFEFESNIKKLITLLQENKVKFNFATYRFLMGTQPKYLLSWTSSEEASTIYAPFENIAGAKMIMLHLIGLSDVKEQSAGKYKEIFMIRRP